MTFVEFFGLIVFLANVDSIFKILLNTTEYDRYTVMYDSYTAVKLKLLFYLTLC